MPKITLKLPLGQRTFNRKKKAKLKLVNKTVKKEPRKASFPWDLGLLFGKPMIYALISGFNLFKT